MSTKRRSEVKKLELSRETLFLLENPALVAPPKSSVTGGDCCRCAVYG